MVDDRGNVLADGQFILIDPVVPGVSALATLTTAFSEASVSIHATIILPMV